MNISNCELPIMKALWDNKKLTSIEINEIVGGNNSTIKNFIQRLVKKEIIKCEKVNSKTFLYTAIITKDEFVKTHLQETLDLVFDGDLDAFKGYLNCGF